MNSLLTLNIFYFPVYTHVLLFYQKENKEPIIFFQLLTIYAYIYTRKIYLTEGYNVQHNLNLYTDELLQISLCICANILINTGVI